MWHFFKHGNTTTVLGPDGKSTLFTKVGDNLALGSDGTMVSQTPGSGSFTVTTPGGSTEFFTQAGNTAFGTGGTNIIGTGSSGMVFKP